MHTVHRNIFLWYSSGVNLWSTYLEHILCNLFCFLDSVTVASYTEDTTSYSNGTKALVVKEMEIFSEVLVQQFYFN